MPKGPMSIQLGRRVPWNYDPDDVSHDEMYSGWKAGRLLSRFNRLQTTTHIQYIIRCSRELVSSFHLTLVINHPFHLLFTSTNCSLFMFILFLSRTFLHTKPLDNRFGCTFLSYKLYNNNCLCIGSQS